MSTQVVRVSFKKQVSDGNYGSEVSEVTFEYQLEHGEDPSSFAETLREQARHQVHMELLKSPSASVRHAVQPSQIKVVVGADDDDDDQDLPY